MKKLYLLNFYCCAEEVEFKRLIECEENLFNDFRDALDNYIEELDKKYEDDTLEDNYANLLNEYVDEFLKEHNYKEFFFEEEEIDF